MTAWFIKVLAVLGAAALVAALVGGVFVFSSIQHGFAARDTPTVVEETLARAMRSMATPASVKRMRNPVQPTSEALVDARHHWADHCATCHANDGSGDTPIGRNLYPKSPDMRKAPTQNLSDGELYAIIENGIRLTGMPAWGSGGEDDLETWKCVTFIRHLPTLTAEELAEMKTMNPMSPAELHEEQQESEFLQGDEVKKSPAH